MNDCEKYIKSAIKAVVSMNIDVLEKAISIVIKSLENGGKLLICGNGGSAVDAQHLAGEFIGRFRRERDALPAIALTANTATITAIANDYGYEYIFSRQIEALGKKGDVLLAISTSGNSPNVLRAVKSSKKAGIRVISFTGENGGKLAGDADVAVRASSFETSHAQEVLLIAGHALCNAVEEHFYSDHPVNKVE